MAKTLYVQIKGVSTAIILKADKVERQTTSGSITKQILTVSLEGNQIGEFTADSVDGWWITEK